jgi:hypothetical protein
MTQARSYQRSDRIQSAGSPTGGGVVVDQNEYATQTLFDHIKEKKVDHILISYTYKIE